MLKTPNDYVIGIDLGGTNVSVASVAQNRRIRNSCETMLEPEKGADAGIKKIIGMVESIIQQEDTYPLAFGIGATGPVLREQGLICNPYTLPGWESVSIVDAISNHFDIEGCLENDADAFALGEYWAYGQEKPSRLYAFTIGTGIGSAFILDGRIYRGTQGLHPEAGHIIVDKPGDFPCYCGASGCLESLVAGPAIGRQAQQAATEHGGLMLSLSNGDISAIDSRIAVAAAKAGDTVATRVLDQVGKYLGTAITQVYAFLMPDVVILGGGIAQEFELLRGGIESIVYEHTVFLPKHAIHIIPSNMGRAAGMLGAAYMAYIHLEENP